ncbi:MAG TPA: HTTM domain-containing protein [Candidatus Acidoferrales bacterium]|nr:HTTM domain-containing protein [Candidatus Acidoferrales bacterium]
MKLKSLVEAWNTFFFAEQSPTPIALFRILYGLMVLATLILLRPDWFAWYGAHAWMSVSTMHALEPGHRLNLLSVLPQKDAWIGVFFWVFLGSVLCLLLGFLTRLNSIVVFLCLVSIQQRNLYILHGGDSFLRVSGFFLMFAPAGAALSVDRLIRIWRGKEGAEVRPRAPWAQRMIQFELAILYFATFCWKIQGAPWAQGTALYYVYHVDELQRFPVPSWFLRPTILKIGTWAGLALEFSLGVLIWVRELRYYLLAMGVIFHLWLEYSINVPMFQWDVLSAYVLFIEPNDLTRAWNWLRERVTKRLGTPITVYYDGGSERLRARANFLRAIDIFRRLALTDLRTVREAKSLDAEIDQGRLAVDTPAGLRQGSDAMRALTSAVPLLWPLAVLWPLRRLRTLGIAFG